MPLPSPQEGSTRQSLRRADRITVEAAIAAPSRTTLDRLIGLRRIPQRTGEPVIEFSAMKPPNRFIKLGILAHAWLRLVIHVLDPRLYFEHAQLHAATVIACSSSSYCTNSFRLAMTVATSVADSHSPPRTGRSWPIAEPSARSVMLLITYGTRTGRQVWTTARPSICN